MTQLTNLRLSMKERSFCSMESKQNRKDSFGMVWTTGNRNSARKLVKSMILVSRQSAADS